jgi:hypothetical protein
LVRTSAGWRIARTSVKIARIGELASNAKAHELPFPVVIG